MTTTTVPVTCDFDWCISDHLAGETLHRQAEYEIEDLYGQARTLGLFVKPETGQTGVFLGEHEISVTTAAQLRLMLDRIVALGVEIPGALR